MDSSCQNQLTQAVTPAVSIHKLLLPANFRILGKFFEKTDDDRRHPDAGHFEGQLMANWVNAAWIASLLDEHAAALELFASQWTDSPEDCVQAAIIELTQQPAPPHNVAAWLFHVVRLRSISANRSAVRRRHHESVAARLVRASTKPNDAQWDAKELAAALSELDDEQREVIVAKTWGGLGFADIAAMIGTSTATAFRRYEAGLTSLRARLESSCTKTDKQTPISKPTYPKN